MYHSYTIYHMAEQRQKTQKSTSVRIYLGTKERLEKVVRKVAANEDRDVTETELVSQAVDQFCSKAERKLGIKVEA